MQPLLHYIEGINRDESIGTVLFDSKKFKKTIKLIRVVKKNNHDKLCHTEYM